MAFGITTLGSWADTSNAATYNGPVQYTATRNALLVGFLVNNQNASCVLGGISGMGLNWQLGSFITYGTVTTYNRLTAYWATTGDTESSTGTIQATFSIGQRGAAFTLIQIQGYDPVNPPFVQAVGKLCGGTAATHGATLAALGSTINWAIVGAGYQANPTSIGVWSGGVRDAYATHSGPIQCISMGHGSNVTVPTFGYSGAAAGAVLALEVRAYIPLATFIRSLSGIVLPNLTGTRLSWLRRSLPEIIEPMFSSGRSIIGGAAATFWRNLRSWGAGAPLTVYDDFNRGDESPLSGNWTTLFGNGIYLKGSMATHTNADNPDSSKYSGVTFSSDHYAKFKQVGAYVDTGIFPVTRAQNDTSGNYYLMYHSAGSWGIWRKQSAANTSISATIYSQSVPADGDTWELRSIGTHHLGYHNGTLCVTGTDNVFSGGAPGIDIYKQGCALDNFQAGNIVATSYARLRVSRLRNLIRGLVSPVPRVVSGADDFDRSDGGLGTLWTETRTGIGLVNNLARATQGGGYLTSLYNAGASTRVFSFNQFAEATLAGTADGSEILGVAVRCSPGNSGSTFQYQFGVSDNYWFVERVDVADVTNLGGGWGRAATVGDHLRLEVYGTEDTVTLRAYTNGTLSRETTDTSAQRIITDRNGWSNPGIVFTEYGAAYSAKLDNFKCGDLGDGLRSTPKRLGEYTRSFSGWVPNVISVIGSRITTGEIATFFRTLVSYVRPIDQIVDNFNRADTTPTGSLGSMWACCHNRFHGGEQSAGIINNVAIANTSHGDSWLYTFGQSERGNSISIDQYAEVTVATLPTVGAYGVGVRLSTYTDGTNFAGPQDGNSWGYITQWDSNTSNMSIYRQWPGANVVEQLTPGNWTVPISAGDTIRLEAEGETPVRIRLYVNGSLIRGTTIEDWGTYRLYSDRNQFCNPGLNLGGDWMANGTVGGLDDFKCGNLTNKPRRLTEYVRSFSGWVPNVVSVIGSRITTGAVATFFRTLSKTTSITWSVLRTKRISRSLISYIPSGAVGSWQDTFDRADGTLGSMWENDVPGTNYFQISGSMVKQMGYMYHPHIYKFGVGSGDARMVGLDQWAEVTVGSALLEQYGNYGGLALRIGRPNDSSPATYYNFMPYNYGTSFFMEKRFGTIYDGGAGDTSWTIQQAGMYTNGESDPLKIGDVLRYEVSGYATVNLIVYKNGTYLDNSSFTIYQGGSHWIGDHDGSFCNPGIAGVSEWLSLKFDSFRCGTLGSVSAGGFSALVSRIKRFSRNLISYIPPSGGGQATIVTNATAGQYWTQSIASRVVIPSVSNGYMAVFITSEYAPIASVVFEGTTLSQICRIDNGQQTSIGVFGFASPVAGTGTLYVYATANSGIAVNSLIFSGVDQSNPIQSYGSVSRWDVAGGSVTVSLTSESGGFYADMVACGGSPLATGWGIVGNGQTAVWQTTTNNQGDGWPQSSSIKSSSGASGTMSMSNLTQGFFSQAAIALKPAPASGFSAIVSQIKTTTGAIARSIGVAFQRLLVSQRKAEYIRRPQVLRSSTSAVKRVGSYIRRLAHTGIVKYLLSRANLLRRSVASIRPLTTAVGYLRSLKRSLSEIRPVSTAVKRVGSYIRTLARTAAILPRVIRAIGGTINYRTVATLRAVTQAVSRRAQYIRRVSHAIRTSLGLIQSKMGISIRYAATRIAQTETVQRIGQYTRRFTSTRTLLGTVRRISWKLRAASVARATSLTVKRIGQYRRSVSHSIRSVFGLIQSKMGITIRYVRTYLTPTPIVRRNVLSFIRRVSTVISRQFSARRVVYRIRAVATLRSATMSVRRFGALWIRRVSLPLRPQMVASRIGEYIRKITTVIPRVFSVTRLKRLTRSIAVTMRNVFALKRFTAIFRRTISLVAGRRLVLSTAITAIIRIWAAITRPFRHEDYKSTFTKQNEFTTNSGEKDKFTMR